jgi:hypothetical protein
MAGRASAGEMQQVEMDDGSVMCGEIVSMEGHALTMNSGDMEALISDPKIMRLLNNPVIQDILKEALKQ